MSIRYVLLLVFLVGAVFCQFEEVKRRIGLRYMYDQDAPSDVVGMLSQDDLNNPRPLLRGRYGKRSNLPPILY
ncbi:unnamed protein product, partial [Mesorhabditis spiculigera]